MSSNSTTPKKEHQSRAARWLGNNLASRSSSSYQADYESKSNDYVRQKEHKATLNVTREGTRSFLKIAASALTGSPSMVTNTEVEKNQNKRGGAKTVREGRKLDPIPVKKTERAGAMFSGGVRAIPGGKTASQKVITVHCRLNILVADYSS